MTVPPTQKNRIIIQEIPMPMAAPALAASLVPSIYCIGPPNDGSVFRNGHQIDLVDFAIDHEQASPCSFCRFVPANTVQGHAGAGNVQVAAERN